MPDATACGGGSAIDAIRNDPEWKNGAYTTQPRSLRTAAQMLWLMSSNPILRQKAAPTLAAADKEIDTYVDNYVKTGDANDILYALEASRDYDPLPGLEKIKAPLLAVNSADDLVNPPELADPREGDRPRAEGARGGAAAQRQDLRPWDPHAGGCLEVASRGPAADLGGVRSTTQAPSGPNPDIHYQLGPDSLPRADVPKGEVRGPFVIESQAYPGTQHTYWVYVPAQYDRDGRRRA